MVQAGAGESPHCLPAFHRLRAAAPASIPPSLHWTALLTTVAHTPSSPDLSQLATDCWPLPIPPPRAKPNCARQLQPATHAPCSCTGWHSTLATVLVYSGAGPGTHLEWRYSNRPATCTQHCWPPLINTASVPALRRERVARGGGRSARSAATANTKPSLHGRFRGQLDSFSSVIITPHLLSSPVWPPQCCSNSLSRAGDVLFFLLFSNLQCLTVWTPQLWLRQANIAGCKKSLQILPGRSGGGNHLTRLN